MGYAVTTGYYIISSTQPTVGSVYLPSQVPFYSTFMLDIYLNIENSALLTIQQQQQTSQLIITGLLGGITGLMQTFSYFMGTTESTYNYALDKIKSKRNVRDAASTSKKLQTNFDRVSIFATRTSLMLADSSLSSKDITIEDFT